MLSNLESFARIDYGDDELLLGVASLSDPATRIARDLLVRHPQLDAKIVLTDARATINPKVAQLVGLAAEARGDVLFISDSNVRVDPDYLGTLVDELDEDERVGLVTNLFVGTGERSFGAALENLQLIAYVTPLVAASALLSSTRSLTVGKSMALTRAAHDAIGGFASVGGVLAEDHLLGRRVREAGFAVKLCVAPVENCNVACDASRTLERHTRWAKMRRAIAPIAFAFEPASDPLLIAVVASCVAPCTATLLALAIVAPWKMLSAWLVTWLLRGHPLALRYMPIELVRSAMAILCWLRACASRSITWRGNAFVLHADSVIACGCRRDRWTTTKSVRRTKRRCLSPASTPFVRIQ